jgi:hypothetical protein
VADLTERTIRRCRTLTRFRVCTCARHNECQNDQPSVVYQSANTFSNGPSLHASAVARTRQLLTRLGAHNAAS